MNLTIKQKRFIDSFDGNATESARKAGYKNPNVAGSRLLANDSIKEAIQSREKKRNSKDIAGRKERQRFWTAIMKDTSAKISDRLRASELLGRSEGDFLDRTEVELNIETGVIRLPELKPEGSPVIID